ncbi:MAG: nitroreductase [Alteromonadaceae bacterium]
MSGSINRSAKASLKRLLGEGGVKSLQRLRHQAKLIWLLLFSRTRFLSSLYYCFFSSQFDREHQAVLKGRLAYLRSQGMQQDSHTLLRRNIHRIEKGLIMQPRKAAFALDYIGQTVRVYTEAAINATHDGEELKWATDVLSEYFSAVAAEHLPQQVVRSFIAARVKARNSLKTLDESGRLAQSRPSIPYDFASKVDAGVTREVFLALCTQRRSVRWFEQRTVERALLEQAVDMASLAPSACNRQPYRFYIADDPQLSKKLVTTAPGTKGFAHNVPCTIVVTADLANYPTERDRHLIYIDSTLASMQLMLALETLGLSSCPINWPDIDVREHKMVSLLGLSGSQRPIMLMAVGYAQAQGKIPFSQKKSASQLINYVEH